MSNGSILIVEDNEGIAHLMDRSLSRAGFAVQSKASGAQALDECNFESIDLFIVDYQLDGRYTGVEFLKQVQQNGFSIPAILVTGFGDETVLLEALRLGVRDFLPKNENLLEILPLIVERVMGDVAREKQLVEAEKARRAQLEVQAALDAATIGYWSENYQTKEIVWPHRIIPKRDAASLTLEGPHGDPAILSIVDEADRPEIRNLILAARDAQVPFHIEFRGVNVTKGVRWYRVKGQFEFDSGGNPLKLTGMVWDETEKREQEIRLARSLAEVELLAERLKVSMMETHHRVKNSFQIVRSLLNMELRKAGSLSESAVKRVLAHLQGLALIHDILTDNVKSSEASALVSSSELINRLADTFRGADPGRNLVIEMVDLPVTARIGSTLAVIATELFTNALKYGVGTILIQSGRIKDDRARLVVRNQCAPDASGGPGASSYEKGGVGNELITFLARADFKSDLKVVQEDEHFSIELEFPIEKIGQGRSTLPLSPSMNRIMSGEREREIPKANEC